MEPEFKDGLGLLAASELHFLFGELVFGCQNEAAWIVVLFARDAVERQRGVVAVGIVHEIEDVETAP